MKKANKAKKTDRLPPHTHTHEIIRITNTNIIMPLLNKQKFVKNAIPDDLDPSEEVFFSKLTLEIFRDYE